MHASRFIQMCKPTMPRPIPEENIDIYSPMTPENKQKRR